KTLSEMVSDDLEFYHDKTGLSVGKPVFLASIKNNICGKVHRTLVPGTLEVYPLKGYGAVEIGVHRFTHPGMDDDLGEAKFTHIWHNKDGTWKLTRVISYDHERLRK
ncbi:MAG: nuclear transport factor 2 family protein, partial [Gemmatimonadaceae bacterium]